MVQAILEGRKTMTRRTKGLEKFNESLDQWRYDGTDDENDGAHYMEMIDNNKNPLEYYKEVVPAYNVGDVLWVRETFGQILSFDKFCYKADMPLADLTKPVLGWKPSIFMPKHACRIFLKVKSVRVERLQEINLYDIIKEGVQLDVFKIRNLLEKYGKDNPAFYFLPEGRVTTDYEAHKLAWADLWISINGMQSWISNPFVFVYEFERIEKPLDFIV